MNRKQFLEVLFDADDISTCGKDDKGATYPKPVFPDLIADRGLKFSINPIIKWRNEENVLEAGLHSMLFEMDRDDNKQIISRDEQVRLFKSSGLPYSTMMWSGSKSVHVIVRLNETIPKAAFNPLWEAIERVLTKHGCFIDPATKKIPQISRMPNSIRENGNRQDLIDVRTRIDLKDLGEWLKQNDEKVIKPQPIKPFVPIKSDKSNLDKWRIARNWTENKHGIYSSTWTTGGWMWLVNFGINLRKLECSLDQGISMSQIEWGQWVETGLGKRDITDPITKGWSWLNNKK